MTESKSTDVDSGDAFDKAFDTTSTFKTFAPALAVAMGTFAYVTTEFIPVGILPEVASSFGISTGDAGLMLTLPGIMAALGAPGVMLLAGGINRRTILLLLSLLLVASCALSAAAPSYEWMLLSRGMFGFGLGGFWSLAIALAPALIRENLVPKAAALIFSGVSIALIIGVPLGTYISSLWGWRATFVVVGTLACLTAIAQLMYLPSLPAQSKFRISSMRESLMLPLGKTSLICGALVFVGHFSTYTFVAPLLLRAGVSSQGITLVLLAFGAIGFLTNILITNLLPHKIYGVLLISIGAIAAALIALPFITSVPILLFGAIIVWGATWGSIPLCTSTLQRLVPVKNAEASSVVFMTVIQISIASGSGLGGAIVDSFGLPQVFLFGGAACLASLTFLATRKA